MAFHRSILIVFFLSSLAFQSSKSDSVDDVCSTTPDPDFCKTSFRSARSAGSDYKTLAQVGIGLAQSRASSASSLIEELGQKASDPKVKGIYDTCRSNYGDVSGDLNDAVSALNSGDFDGLNLRASLAMDACVTSDGLFGQLSVPEPDELKASSDQVRTLSSAIAAIANKLKN